MVDTNVLCSSTRMLVGDQFGSPLFVLVHINCTYIKSKTSFTASDSITYYASEEPDAVTSYILECQLITPFLPVHQIPNVSYLRAPKVVLSQVHSHVHRMR